ncbi:MAG: prephenate dehydrogenase [Planctomycetes bacterium]|nr:prephenate dehydrogenase [Planctomycetota bacterium]
METENKCLGIIGLGAFGRFMAKHLLPWFSVKGWDSAAPDRAALERDGAGEISLESMAQVAGCDMVIFAVPWSSLAEAVELAKPHMRPDALVLDVTSVKSGPAELLPRLLPESVSILCTHPLFGPQSGKNGIAGLRIALCPIRIEKERYFRICDFLTDKLGLLVIKTNPDQHDREMARVQAMTHFMSRALKAIGLKPSLLSTRAYEKLQEFSSIVLSDSWDLFLTIQNGNPYAEEIRHRLQDEMDELESRLKESELELKKPARPRVPA